MENNFCYEIKYKDDFNRTHITFSNDEKDVSFLKARFDDVQVTKSPIDFIKNLWYNIYIIKQ